MEKLSQIGFEVKYFEKSRKSNIIGATTLGPLKENIDSFKVKLSDDLLDEIDKIHDENPYPCP